jgi:hypothetical protein
MEGVVLILDRAGKTIAALEQRIAQLEPLIGRVAELEAEVAKANQLQEESS